MTKFSIFAAMPTALLLATPVFAQQVPAAAVAVVDIERATADCTACKSATVALQGQVTAIQNLRTQLAAPLETEQRSIQAALNALNGKDPDAALTARAQAFEKKQQDANAQLAAREQAFQANRNYVMQQIGQKLEPILASVMQKRGANILVDGRSALRYGPAVDVTNDVIAQLNASVPSLATTAPAAAARPAAKPAGR